LLDFIASLREQIGKKGDAGFLKITEKFTLYHFISRD
jgi:hypothetical protein